jgi:tetratricopeptide (TPR) repeat protein
MRVMLSQTTRTLSIALCLLTGICAHAAPPAGDPRTDEAQARSREHYLKGTKAYELGLYDEAIAEYTAAYKAKDYPALLFNLGQAHRMAGHPAEAARLFRMYLIKNPDAQDRAEIEARIRELEKPAPSRPVATPSAATPSILITTNASPPRHTPLYKRWWLWTAVGGAIALGVGLGVGLALAPAPAAPSVSVTSGTYRF